MSSGSVDLFSRRADTTSSMRARREPLFGLFASPAAADLDALWAVVETAERAGVDLLTIQDHPYNPAFLDTWTLLVAIAARTERIHVMPNVASLPLRPPAMLAKAAATLQLVSGGRVELGLGAGASWDGIESLGQRRLTPAQAVDALEEALSIIGLVLGTGEERTAGDGRAGGAVSYEGRWYRLSGAMSGPRVDRIVPVWLGAMRPRMLRLTGARADGWSVSRPYIGPDRLAAMHRTIDDAARTAGRDPAAIRRGYNLVGAIDERATEMRIVGQGIPVGPAAAWAALLAETYEALDMDTLVFAPAGGDQVEQMRRFAEEVMPRARDAIREAVTR